MLNLMTGKTIVEITIKQELRVHLVHKAQLVQQVQLAHKVFQELMVLKVHKGLQGQQVLQTLIPLIHI